MGVHCDVTRPSDYKKRCATLLQHIIQKVHLEEKNFYKLQELCGIIVWKFNLIVKR
jgi:hypothetical protein